MMRPHYLMSRDFSSRTLHEPEYRAGFPACRFTGLSSPLDPKGRLESRPNPQAGKPALRASPGSWSQCISKRNGALHEPHCVLAVVLALVFDPMAWLRGRAGGRLGSWSQCTASESWGLSTNEGADQILIFRTHCWLASQYVRFILISGSSPEG